MKIFLSSNLDLMFSNDRPNTIYGYRQRDHVTAYSLFKLIIEKIVAKLKKSERKLKNYKDAYDEMKVILLESGKNSKLFLEKGHNIDLSVFMAFYSEVLCKISEFDSKIIDSVNLLKKLDVVSQHLPDQDIENIFAMSLIPIYIEAIIFFADYYLSCKNLLPYATFDGSHSSRVVKNVSYSSALDYIRQSLAINSPTIKRVINNLMTFFDKRVFDCFDISVCALVIVEHLDLAKRIYSYVDIEDKKIFYEKLTDSFLRQSLSLIANTLRLKKYIGKYLAVLSEFGYLYVYEIGKLGIGKKSKAKFVDMNQYDHSRVRVFDLQSDGAAELVSLDSESNLLNILTQPVSGSAVSDPIEDAVENELPVFARSLSNGKVNSIDTDIIQESEITLCEDSEILDSLPDILDEFDFADSDRPGILAENASQACCRASSYTEYSPKISLSKKSFYSPARNSSINLSRQGLRMQVGSLLYEKMTENVVSHASSVFSDTSSISSNLAALDNQENPVKRKTPTDTPDRNIQNLSSIVNSQNLNYFPLGKKR